MPNRKQSRQRTIRKGSGRESRPNVYIAPAKGAPARTGEPPEPAAADGASISTSVVTTAQSVAARRARARAGRQTRARSEVFTRSLPSELRKLGVLTGGAVVILVVLTFVLG